MTKFLSALCFTCLAIAGNAQTKANYELASRFSPEKQKKMLFTQNVDPHWLKSNNKFWYEFETPNSQHWYIVDASTGSKKDMFDPVKLAAQLTLIVKYPFEAHHLPIDSLQFLADENTIRFQIKSTEEIEKKDSTDKKNIKTTKEKKIYYFTYNIAQNKLTELTDFIRPKRNYGWASIAPDSSMVLFSKHFNLYWMSWADYKKALIKEKDSTIVEHQITKDGVDHYAYGSDGDGEDNVEHEKNKDNRRGAYITWSPDSKHFVLHRTDERKVKDLWVINSLSNPRPTLETYRYEMPGDTSIPQSELLLFNASDKRFQRLDLNKFKDQTIGVERLRYKESTRDDDWRPNIWMGDNSKFYVSRSSRDLKKIDYLSVDVLNGKVDSLFGERMNTYINTQPLYAIKNGKEFIEWSERDGWGHYYLYDSNGKLKNQITTGAFHCESIEGVDEKNNILYFTAGGREDGINPYYLHFYKINLDGSSLQLLDKVNYYHTISMNDNATYFVDNYSRADAAPKSILYNGTGKTVLSLDTCDMSSFFAAGYKYPQIIKVKADDGITDLYGVMYKPFNFDSTKKYPLVEYVYPGPQTEAVNYMFGKVADRTDRLAQIGLVVITIGNRGGNPARSKWYHTFGYGNLRDYGLADKKAAAEQLCAKYSFLDINRIGIHGHSGGGFMSTAAMFVYPDFFKVAVSSSGNHDNRIYNRWWSETHNGVKENISAKGDTSFEYHIATNPSIAKNLKGHLMLTTGDIDNNVHPGNTYRVIDALIKANKRFDFLLLPGQRHAYGNMQEYFFWRLCDYYSQYLLNDWRRPVDMIEADKDIPDTN
ncbi:S9 family peptidase [Rhizosphaericola mali]|uniref:Prolyl oligopeptidase family serine peptidase n=1 Tax=Rhizosphaericola mali TaxID=2545455 RepID=A0A5P2G6X9_9BACT|nr:DPP IV N-terminal domain-containing protein [Rhizosphaericola mali]QES88983.1 prolyl oligopeptidase family serine peptidase [Rhizosphaericola mali]